MRSRRLFANFLIKTCGLRKLHNSKLQRLIRSTLDEIDLQHLRDTNPCRSFHERTEMYRYLHESCIAGEAMEYLEFGVYQGESIKYWADLNRHKESRFTGFDSFEGLPENWREGQGKGHFDVGGNVPLTSDPRIKFVKGWFDRTVPPFAREFATTKRLVVHLDADLYSSSMFPLVFLGPLMSAGTLLIFDEFYDREHEFKALMDWRKIYRKDVRIIAEMENYSKVCAQLT